MSRDRVGQKFTRHPVDSVPQCGEVPGRMFRELSLMPSIEITDDRANLAGRTGLAIGVTDNEGVRRPPSSTTGRATGWSCPGRRSRLTRMFGTNRAARPSR